MNPPPAGDEELHIVPRDTPTPRLVESATTETNQPVPSVSPPDRGQPVARGSGLTFAGSILLIAVAFTVGLSYLLEKRWPHHSTSASQAETEATANADALSSGGQLKAEMLHVTAVSLGASRLAVVNGKPVAEGEFVLVPTSSGAAQVRVRKIEDGVVHFLYGQEQIDVKVNSTDTRKSPP